MMEKTVIKLNNIPHGFYEDEMRKYFKQFGTVKRVVLIRSKKSGKSRGFGFVEFEYEAPAKAASESMHNYLMFNHVLKCRLIDRKKVEKVLKSFEFKKGNKRPITSLEKYKQHHNNVVRRDQRYLVTQYRKILRTQKLLEKMGIKLSCKILNPPDLSRDTDSLTSGSTNSGETFSTTSDGSNLMSDSEISNA